jgi:hypothetical protein
MLIMDWKKFMFGVMFLISLTATVSAQFYLDLERGAVEVIDEITNFMRPFFEWIIGDYSGSDFFLVKSLLLVLLFVVINVILKKTKLGEKNSSAVVIVAMVVSIMAVRFMPDNQIFSAILLPYSTLGIAIATLVPFFIFFYMLHASKMSGVGRRIGGLIYGVIFVTLFINQYASGRIEGIGLYVYAGIIAALVLAFFFDRGIQRYFFAHELNIFFRGQQSRAVASLQSEYMNILNVDTPEAENRRNAIESQLRRLGAGIP